MGWVLLPEAIWLASETPADWGTWAKNRGAGGRCSVPTVFITFCWITECRKFTRVIVTNDGSHIPFCMILKASATFWFCFGLFLALKPSCTMPRRRSHCMRKTGVFLMQCLRQLLCRPITLWSSLWTKATWQHWQSRLLTWSMNTTRCGSYQGDSAGQVDKWKQYNVSKFMYIRGPEGAILYTSMC